MSNDVVSADADVIGRVRAAWNCQKLVVRRQLFGKSGARLYLVDVIVDGYDGNAILKLSPDDLREEANKQSRANQLCPTFSDHFPRVLKSDYLFDTSALLMTVAGSGLLFTNPFSSIDRHGARLLAAQKITSALLNDWNYAASANGSEHTAGSLLSEWLGRRIGPNSRLPGLIEDLYDINPDSSGIEVLGEKLPNPYAFANSLAARDPRTRITPVCGFVHGDFHGANVLVSELQQPKSEFYIIDFASFEEAKPLLFDNAYFELSFLLRQRANATPDRWMSIIKSLENIEDTALVPAALEDAEDQGVTWCVASMRSSVSSWMNVRFPERKEDLEKQKVLARVAAGLNFAQKSTLDSVDATSSKLKEFAFLYAASNLRRFCNFTRLTDKFSYQPARKSRGLPLGTNAWREVWDACDGFNKNKSSFILVAGPRLGRESEFTHATIARVPWSLVLDFNPDSDKGHLLTGAKSKIESARGFHLVIPGQTPAVTFARGVCWLMANGWRQRPDSIQGTLVAWRQRTVPAIRMMAEQLRHETAPKPVKIVVMGEGIEGPKLRAAATLFEEILPHAKFVIVTNGTEDRSFDEISGEVSDAIHGNCSYSDLSMGLHRMFGDALDNSEVFVPARDAKGNLTRTRIEASKVALFNESFELVHDGAIRGDAQTAPASDFFKGNTITWRELDIGMDVPREVTSAIQNEINQKASRSRLAAVAVEHTPGAGGTTIARRLAWASRNNYPTIMLTRFTETTSELIESLAHQTNLPIFVVIERRDLSDADRDNLIRDLKGRYVRCVFLDVVRALKPRDNGTTIFALSDPMSASEAELFFERYSKLALPQRQKSLKQLTRDQGHRDFRSAFFYGFYSFEEEFLRVPEFVEAHLNPLPEAQKEIVSRLALITRYSQSRLPNDCLSLLSDSDLPSDFGPDDLLGHAKRLVVFDVAALGVVHPMIAQEILSYSLGGKNWRSRLADFCVSFIRNIGKSPQAYGENIGEILVQLFVERSIWDGATQRLFSNLVETIPTREGQRRVLETLCDTFPSNPHFWNHLGRHLNIRIRAPYAESERCFLKAIELDPKNEIHHHGLGMVYRFEVRSRLGKPLEKSELIAGRIENIEELFEKAESCFKTAHDLDDESEHPLVTHIQIIIESIERVFNLSGEKKYEDFVNRQDEIGNWCRAKLQTAENLLADLKRAQAESEHSKYTVECESRLMGLYGNFEAMVRGLTGLLSRENINKTPIRRLIAYCHLRSNKDDFDRIDKTTARRIADMMLDNLSENPGNGTDIRIWLRAFRMLPEFTITEALERIGTWAALSDNIDAYYYLYVLNYIHLTRGAHASLEEVRKNIELCRRKAPLLVSKRSFEWWASESLNRSCHLVHHSELSGWDRGAEFWSNREKLGYVEGIIDDIRSPQAGHILLHGLRVFFVPARLQSSTDVNAKVKFHLGFSYEGLRAWNVQLIN